MRHAVAVKILFAGFMLAREDTISVEMGGGGSLKDTKTVRSCFSGNFKKWLQGASKF